jgi:cell wall-associated NlpC family hydrolase
MGADNKRASLARAIRFSLMHLAMIAVVLSGMDLDALLLTPASAQQPAKRTSLARASRRHHARCGSHRHHRVRPQSDTQFVLPQGDGSPLLAFAARLVGRPYRFGSEDGAFDCSGFVRRVFAAADIDLPHSVQEQFARGEQVRRTDLEPGDLVFFRGEDRRHVSHVGIYLGDDKFIHAARHARRVQVDSLSDPYYTRHFVGARRVDI